MLKGIDVSKHQGKIDWVKVKASGEVDFAIIRAGYGKNNIDEQARYNCLKCNELGIPIGLYWFSYAYTVEMARMEALYLTQFASSHLIEYPLYYDCEYDTVTYAKKRGVTLDKRTVTDMAAMFCKTLEEKGFYAGVYTNQHYLNTYFDKKLFDRFDMWFARYGKSAEEYKAMGKHLIQTSESGIIPGIQGEVDTDLAFIDFKELIHRKGLNNIIDDPFTF